MKLISIICLFFIQSCSLYYVAGILYSDYSNKKELEREVKWCEKRGGYGYKSFSPTPFSFYCRDGSRWKIKEGKYIYDSNLKEEGK